MNHFYKVFAAIIFSCSATVHAQNLMLNGDFNNSAASYNTACVSIEAAYFETTYGGTDGNNHVAEVDDESCFYQDVCILSGVNYIFSMKAGRRTNGSPASLSTLLTIEGLNAANAVVGAPLVSTIFTRTNTAFALTSVTGVPVVSVPTGSPIVRLRITLKDTTAGYSTLGMIVDDLNLTYQTPPAYVGPLSACQFSPVLVDISNLPATGVSYNWALGTGATPATANIRNPTVSWSTIGVNIISCTLSNGVCDVSKINANIDVRSFPSAPVVVSPVNYCLGDIAPKLLAGFGSGNTLLWYTSATGGTGDTVAPTPNTSSQHTTTYYVSQRNTVCGEGPRSAIVVNVGVKPPPPVVTTPLVYCMSSVAPSLTATGNDLKWYSQAVGGTGLPTPPIPNTAYEDTLVYWVTQSNNGCESIRSKQVVQIRFKPNGIILGSSASICQGGIDTFYYYGNGRPNFYYDFKSPLFYSTVLSGNNQGPYIVRFDSAGTFKIRMQVVNDGCVSDEMFFSVTVRPSPAIKMVAKEDACVDEVVNVALYYTTSNVTRYTYDFGAAEMVYGTATGGPYGIKWNTPGDKTITLNANTTGCPGRTTTYTVHVHPYPDARISYVERNDICTGDTVWFSAAEQDSNTRFTWTPANFFVSGNIYKARGVVSKNGYVRLQVESGWGCIAADSVKMNAKPCCELFLPNVFTPNNDGKNDLFRIVTNGHHDIANFRIMNRWGQVVYESKEEVPGWNGVYNGRNQDMGTYYYYVKYQCSNKEYYEQKGEVLLLR